MNVCDDVRRLLPLSAGGDLSADEALVVSLHLANCEYCGIEDEKYRSVVSMARSSYLEEHRVPSAIRLRIASEAAVRASRKTWSWPLLALVPRQVPALATAIAALLVVAAGLPIALRKGSDGASGDEVMRIEVVADGDAVKLAWTDGNHQSYTVYKTSDPRARARQEAHLVRGNVWVDNDPQSSPVVFYRIE